MRLSETSALRIMTIWSQRERDVGVGSHESRQDVEGHAEHGEEGDRGEGDRDGELALLNDDEAGRQLVHKLNRATDQKKEMRVTRMGAVDHSSEKNTELMEAGYQLAPKGGQLHTSDKLLELFLPRIDGPGFPLLGPSKELIVSFDS